MNKRAKTKKQNKTKTHLIQVYTAKLILTKATCTEGSLDLSLISSISEDYSQPFSLLELQQAL